MKQHLKQTEPTLRNELPTFRNGPSLIDLIPKFSLQG